MLGLFFGRICKGCGFQGNAVTHFYICHNHKFGGGEFCDRCARRYNWRCPICGQQMGWKKINNFI